MFYLKFLEIWTQKQPHRQAVVGPRHKEFFIQRNFELEILVHNQFLNRNLFIFYVNSER